VKPTVVQYKNHLRTTRPIKDTYVPLPMHIHESILYELLASQRYRDSPVSDRLYYRGHHIFIDFTQECNKKSFEKWKYFTKYVGVKVEDFK